MRVNGDGEERTGLAKKKSKMPANVLAYFKYRSAGMSKQAAKRKAGLLKK